MNILFLCGSLEPGRDGVGDYVRCLSGELSKQGHHASAIALNDQYIHEAFFGSQISEGESIMVLRLPSIWKANKRFARAEQWANKFNPEWVSLQFVPFSFHPKGLPFFLSKQIFTIGIGRRWHIMFHELWVGMNAESSKKNKIWGRIQMNLIKRLVLKLNPIIIHTQTLVYQAQLRRIGLQSQILPLFTNIPISNKYKNNFSALPTNNLAKNVNLVVFGSIHPNTPIISLADDAAFYAQQNLASVTLTIVGRCGPEQHHWIDTWKAAGLPVNVLGEQAAESISQILHNASLGITTTPISLVEKSGTVAAMREHGLPILCVTHPWTPIGIDNHVPPPNTFSYNNGSFEIYLIKKSFNNNQNTLSNITERLLNDYSACFNYENLRSSSQ